MTATDNITISRAVVEQALETLSNERYVSRYSHIEDAITHLTAALEAAKNAEPVAWLMTPIDAPNEYPQLDWDTDGWSSKWRKLPLYPTPQLPQKEGWQPIETAPKDGTEFIAAWGHQGFAMMIVSYNKIHGYWQTKGSPARGFLENATHWMPLPAAPKPTEGK